jgi:hypothetical protein
VLCNVEFEFSEKVVTEGAVLNKGRYNLKFQQFLFLNKRQCEGGRKGAETL